MSSETSWITLRLSNRYSIHQILVIMGKQNGARDCPSIHGRPDYKCWGFTIIELLVVVAIIGTLSAIAVPAYFGQVSKAKMVRVIVEIRQISKTIDVYKIDNNAPPLSLADVSYENLRDAWGNLYQYLNIEILQDKDKKDKGKKGEDKEDKEKKGEKDKGNMGKGKMRKNRFLVPINSDYDLYSMGPDGRSVSPLTAKASRDDIIRANNGTYIGLASLY